MGAIDRLFRFCLELAIAAAAGAGVLGTDRVDLRAVAENHLGTAAVTNLGDREVDLVVVVTEALVATATGAILTTQLYEHTLDATITDGNLIHSEATTSIDDAGANFPAGTEIARIRINLDDIDERYIGVNFATSVQAITSGDVTAFLDFDGVNREILN